MKTWFVVDIIKQVASIECQGHYHPDGPQNWFDMPYDYSIEQPDLEVGYGGGLIVELPEYPAECWCGNPMPTEEELEEVIVRFLENELEAAREDAEERRADNKREN